MTFARLHLVVLAVALFGAVILASCGGEDVARCQVGNVTGTTEHVCARLESAVSAVSVACPVRAGSQLGFCDEGRRILDVSLSQCALGFAYVDQPGPGAGVVVMTEWDGAPAWVLPHELDHLARWCRGDPAYAVERGDTFWNTWDGSPITQ